LTGRSTSDQKGVGAQPVSKADERLGRITQFGSLNLVSAVTNAPTAARSAVKLPEVRRRRMSHGHAVCFGAHARLQLPLNERGERPALLAHRFSGGDPERCWSGAAPARMESVFSHAVSVGAALRAPVRDRAHRNRKARPLAGRRSDRNPER